MKFLGGFVMKRVNGLLTLVFLWQRYYLRPVVMVVVHHRQQFRQLPYGIKRIGMRKTGNNKKRGANMNTI